MIEDYTEKECGDCCYWHEGELTPDLTRQGICRRFPPTPTVIPTNQGMGSAMLGVSMPTNYPACGEFDPGEPVLVQ